MNKIEFMNELRQYLEKAYGKLERNEISVVISDYEEYFREGLIEGKTEDEIVESLGNPKEIVDEIVRNDIEDGKYTQDEFLHYFYPKAENEKIKTKIGDKLKDIDGDTIINGAQKVAHKAQKTVSGMSKFLLILGLFFFDSIYFPLLLGLVVGIVGVGIGGLMSLPVMATVMSVVGSMSIFIIFPALFLIGFVGLVLIALYYLLKFGVNINKYVFKCIRGGRN